MPGLQDAAETPREVPPVYVAATAPKMQALSGEIATGAWTPSITTPAFVRYTRENVKADIDIGCMVVASIHDLIALPGRDGAREIAGMYLANKFQNIRARPTRCSSWPESRWRSSPRSRKQWSGVDGWRPRPR